MNEAPQIMFGLSVAAALALIITGFWLVRQPGGNRTKAALMIVAGLVIIFNAWINSLPVPITPSGS